MTMMKLKTSGRAMAAGKLALAIAATTGLAGCGFGSFMGGAGDAKLADTSATQTEIAQAAPTALPAIATECPPIKIRNGAEALFSYADKKVGDARALNYQAVIDKESRNCVVSVGQINLKMGVVGRLLLGPSGSNSENVTLPLRFAVESNGNAMFTQRYDIPVTVTPPNQSEEFVKVVENVNIPYVSGDDIVIWVGFDPSKDSGA